MNSLIPLLALLSCSAPLIAGQPLFKGTLYESVDGTTASLTIKSLPTKHTYSFAGIKPFTYKHYTLNTGHNSPCQTITPSGWCLFSVSDTQPVIFSLSKQLKDNASANNLPLRIELALNAKQRVVSSQSIEISTNSAGRIIGYLYGWETPPTAEAIKAAGYTHVLIAFGLFSTSSPGTINLEAISGFDLSSYIDSLHENGLQALLSLGGASTNIPNTTVDFDQAVQLSGNPGAFQTTFMQSMASLINQYHFDGFDFDIEHGLNGAASFTDPSQGCSTQSYSAQCDIYYLSNIINGFHAENPAAMLTLAPQIANISATSGFSSVWGNYASLIMQTHNALEWAAFQNYNSGCAYGINLICYPINGNTLSSSPDAAVAFATDLLENWPATTSTGQATGFQPYTSYLSPTQVVIGYVVNNAQGQSDGDPAVNLSVTKNVIQCLRNNQGCDTYIPPNTYPDIGGVFSWTINYDASNQYLFAKSLYPCVVQGNCTS